MEKPYKIDMVVNVTDSTLSKEDILELLTNEFLNVLRDKPVQVYTISINE